MLPYFSILPNQQSECLLPKIPPRSMHILERFPGNTFFRIDEVSFDHALRLGDIQPMLRSSNPYLSRWQKKRMFLLLKKLMFLLLLVVVLAQQSHSSQIDEVMTSNDSKTSLSRVSKFQRIVGVNDLRLFSWLEEPPQALSVSCEVLFLHE